MYFNICSLLVIEGVVYIYFMFIHKINSGEIVAYTVFSSGKFTSVHTPLVFSMGGSLGDVSEEPVT